MIHNLQKLLPLGLFIAVESSLVLAVAMSKVDGRPAYNTSTIVLLVELLKLSISVGSLYAADSSLSELRQVKPAEFLRFSVPGLLYALNNNLFLFVLTQIPPAYFQLLLNLRVFWTGMLFWVIMRRKLSSNKWFSLVVLFIGCILSQGDHLEAVLRNTGSTTSMSLVGLILTVIYTLVSSLAGVYNELLLKSRLSLHAANAQLYAFGVVINLIMLQFQRNDEHAFKGWDRPSTVIIWILMASTGLLISRVVKSFDSIVKIFCVSMSNLTVYCVSVVFLTTQPSMYFLVAFALVSWAARQYAQPDEKPREEEPASGMATGLPTSNRARHSTDDCPSEA